MPSRRTQICPTAGPFSAVRANPGCTAAARSTNRRTAAERARPSASGAASGGAPASPAAAGTGREGTRHAVSPAMPSASRLVARRRTCGQARSRASASRAQASSRCSQLSSTSSTRFGLSASASVASRERPGSSRTPTAAATAWGTRAGSASAPSSASHTPSGVPLQRVGRRLEREAGLAHPPAPVRVSSGATSSSRRTSASSRSRPTKLVSWRGRLCGRAAGAAAARRPGGRAAGAAPSPSGGPHRSRSTSATAATARWCSRKYSARLIASRACTAATGRAST